MTRSQSAPQRVTWSLRLAATSPEVLLGDVDGNLQRIRVALQGAVARGAQLIVLPELATSGYVFADRDEAAAASITRDHPGWARPRVGTAARGRRRRRLRRARRHAAVQLRGRAHARAADRRLPQGAPLGRGGGAVRTGDRPRARSSTPRSAGSPSPSATTTSSPKSPVAWHSPARTSSRCRSIGRSSPRPDGEHPPETIQAMAAARSSRLATVIADRRGGERGVAWTGRHRRHRRGRLGRGAARRERVGHRHADAALPRRQVAAAAQRPVRRSPPRAVLRDGCRGIRPSHTARDRPSCSPTFASSVRSARSARRRVAGDR